MSVGLAGAAVTVNRIAELPGLTAVLDDPSGGRLTAYLVTMKNSWQALFLAVRVMFGAKRAGPYLEVLTGQTVTLANRSRSITVSMDGERRRLSMPLEVKLAATPSSCPSAASVAASRRTGDMSDGTGRQPAIAAMIGGSAIFVLLAILVGIGRTMGFDRPVLTAIRSTVEGMGMPYWLNETVVDLTALGGYPVLTAVVLIASIALWLAARGRATAFLLLSAVGATVLTNIGKAAFSRQRPDVGDHLDLTFTASFPSGHASMSATVWLTLAVIAMGLAAKPGLRAFALFTGIALTVIIGASRLYLGVHWPSDVLAGWALGTAWVAASWLIVRPSRA